MTPAMPEYEMPVWIGLILMAYLLFGFFFALMMKWENQVLAIEKRSTREDRILWFIAWPFMAIRWIWRRFIDVFRD
ncbi:MAG: hypothetical protein ACREB7_01455 [Sphingopyxis sp.]|uniref:hypothetical protein n=1 Tax=Sphingopyxis sp. TaxID=1908224 RepID=UPI003D6D4059